MQTKNLPRKYPKRSPKKTYGSFRRRNLQINLPPTPIQPQLYFSNALHGNQSQPPQSNII